ncbi:hypothetical protein K2X30_00875 [bacterium]|jgi:hypothetical protein|nr:hypothetical protein [bacterium]
MKILSLVVWSLFLSINGFTADPVVKAVSCKDSLPVTHPGDPVPLMILKKVGTNYELQVLASIMETGTPYTHPSPLECRFDTLEPQVFFCKNLKGDQRLQVSGGRNLVRSFRLGVFGGVDELSWLELKIEGVFPLDVRFLSKDCSVEME